jgi:ABC-type branched-subunit amino acid transport system substrate-binding protein
MHRRRPLLLLAATVALSGCSTVDGLVERVRPVQEAGTPVVTLTVLAPLSGAQESAGTTVVDAVQQAMADSGGVTGWEVAVQSVDTTGPTLDDDLDALGSDDTAVAVVGGFAPDDVRTLVPQLDGEGLTVVSPADTDPRHTRGADPSSPLRPWSGYVTVAVEPTPEQTALADHLVRMVGITRGLVVHGSDADSRARAAAVADGIVTRGVTGVSTSEWSTARRSDVIDAVADLSPGDALVVDGDAALARTVAEAAPDGVVLALTAVPASLDDSAAAALDGALAPLPGLDPRRGSDELGSRYAEAGRDADPGRYGPAAYDGARLVVDALGRCLPDPERSTSPSRSACRAEIAGTVWDGLTGSIQLDEYGTRLGLLPAVATLRGGEWS